MKIDKWIGLKITACVLIAFIFLNTNDVSSQTQNPWPMYQHNSQHTGTSPYSGPQSNNVKWALPLVAYLAGQPVISPDGTVYIAGINSSGILYAVSSDGVLKWQSSGMPVSGYCCFFSNLSPVIGPDGTIYIGGLSGLLAFNSDGSLKWNYVPDFFYNQGLSITVGSDGTIYATAGYNAGSDQLLALNSDGTVKWSKTIGGKMGGFHYPALSENGTIYLTKSARSNLYSGSLSVFTTDGNPIWSFSEYGASLSDAVIGPTGTIYLQKASISSSPAFYLKAYDPDGNSLWEEIISSGCDYHPGRYNMPSPAIWGSEMIVVSGCHETMAFNLDGTTKWSLSFDLNEIPQHPVIDTNGTTYIGTDSSDPTIAKIYAISSDGSTKWTYDAVDQVIGSPPSISSDGTLYVSLYDGESLNLYAFGGDSVPLPYKIAFPLKNYTPYDAPVSSIFDHKNISFYKTDGVVKAFNGEEGRCEYGAAEYKSNGKITYYEGKKLEQVCKTIEKKKGVFGYKNEYGSPFLEGVLNYEDDYLWYDGHPGYDYYVVAGRPIQATESGKLYKAEQDSVNGKGNSKTAWDEYHTFYIDHGNGYSSWYLHSESLTSEIEDEIDQNGFATVIKNQTVGTSGSFGSSKNYHLHFEVRRNGYNPENLVDPYKEDLWE